MRRAVLLLAIAAMFMAATAAVGSGPLLGNIEAWKVVATQSGDETFVPAEQAAPRDLIEYRLTYANRGTSALKSVSIIDPVPAGTRYVSRTATQPRGGDVAFSVDNARTFHAWPVRVRKVVDGRETWVDATPEMITHIRWNIADTLDPAGKVNLSYRAVVR